MSSSIDAGNLPEGGGREGFWRWMKPSRRQRSVLPPVGILRRALQDDDGEVKVSHRAALAPAASSHEGTSCVDGAFLRKRRGSAMRTGRPNLIPSQSDLTAPSTPPPAMVTEEVARTSDPMASLATCCASAEPP